MRKRRGFTHWISARIPDKISDTHLLEEYQKLLQPESRNRAAECIILGHIRLGMATVAEFAVRSPHKVDDMVSSMLMALTYGTKKLSRGAVKHHNGQPNITGYLMRTVRGKLLRTVNEGILRRSLDIYNKEKIHVIVQGDEALKNHVKRNSYLAELQEVIASAIEKVQSKINSETKDLVQRIIDLRIDGLNDVAISDKLNLTSSRIQQIRKAVQTAILERL